MQHSEGQFTTGRRRKNLGTNMNENTPLLKDANRLGQGMNESGSQQSLASSKPEVSSRKWSQRHDVIMWAIGILFAGALIGVMFALGMARGWDAQSGFTHNTSVSSQERFWPEPFTEEPGVPGRYGIDCTGRWYYWKLPPNRVTAMTRLFVWASYILHQISVWMFIYYAQIVKASEPANVPKYSTMFKPFNWVLFALNVFFHLLHLLQTHVTYDATAQDVSIASSQSSVIMLLVFVVIMEYRERGLFFGWPTVHNKDKWSQKLRMDFAPINLIRKYHGYAFSWAAIYTFWYHPMENTLGHAMGFANTWMFLLQGSLIYTEFHLNKYWKLLLEVWVAFHGGLVAYQTGGPELNGTLLWPMFAFGFAGVFVITQIFSLPFWRKIHFIFRLVPLAVYLAIAIWCYSWIPDANGQYFTRLSELIRIPGVYYLYFFWGWGLTWVFLKIEKKLQPNEKPTYGPIGKTLFLGLSFFIYFLFVLSSALIQVLDVQVPLIACMILLVGVFMLGICITNILLRQTMRGNRVGSTTPIKNISEPETIVENSKM